MRRLLILPLLAIPVAPLPALAQASCENTKVFKGEAPSAIVQQAFSERFDRPMKAVSCNDDGTCTQTWGKKCQS
ncbi:hypothetical protein [Cyanobium sp. Morenito 9A2]|uniref:hypothetical protein n=1 Tax=Cyanobium sp. Morenito 9A2 TaxID=2823718 RepID=UPI0020CCF041|nr:hypothetical protein [Cyanobium sp. Morenito 9A2]MCP9848547.1 hypothetical protein [Cyanobium sp. Morenito 9A2]